MKYSKLMMEHFLNPNNAGEFIDEVGIGSAVVGRYENGVVVHFQIKILDEKIIAAKFKAYGNCPTIAACSFVTEWVKGKTIKEAESLSSDFIMSTLEIPPLKIHCALLVEDALKAAIKNFQTDRLDEKR